MFDVHEKVCSRSKSTFPATRQPTSPRFWTGARTRDPRVRAEKRVARLLSASAPTVDARPWTSTKVHWWALFFHGPGPLSGFPVLAVASARHRRSIANRSRSSFFSSRFVCCWLALHSSGWSWKTVEYFANDSYWTCWTFGVVVHFEGVGEHCCKKKWW